MKLLRNYLYNAGYQILSILVPVLTAPYVNRVLGPHGIGINTYTSTIVQYFIIAGSLGIAVYGNREIAYLRDNPREMSKVFWEIQIVKTVGIFVATLLYIGYAFNYKNYTEFLLLQYANLFAAALDISWFFQGLENFKVTVVRNTVVKLISVVLIFSLIHTQSDLYLYILISGVSALVGNATLWPYVKEYLVHVHISSLHPLHHVKSSVALFIPQAALQIYQVLNKTILGIFAGTNATGFYNNADTIEKMLLSLVTAIGTVMLPHAAHAFANGKKKQINELMYKSANVTTCVTIAFTFGIAAISLKFAPIFFGEKFAVVGNAMLIEAPVIYFAGISGVLGTQYLIPTGQTKDYSASLIFGAVVSIILNFSLIPFWELTGAMISTVISEFAVMLYQVWVVMKKSRQLEFAEFFEDTWKYLIAGGIMFAIVFSLDRMTSTSLVWLGLEIIIGGIIYFVAIIGLRPRVILLLQEILKNKVKNRT